MGVKRKGEFEAESRIKRRRSDETDSEEDEQGNTSDAANEAQPGAGFEQFHGTRKLPTGHEVTQISKSTSLYRSTQFHALLESLLLDVLPPETAQASLDKFLHELHPFLTSIPAFQAMPPNDADKKLSKKGVSVPWPVPPPAEDVQYKVSFEQLKPEDILVAGSYAGKKKTCTRSREGKYVVDLALSMNAESLQEKDYRDNRIFHKRAFFIAYVASALAGSKSPWKGKLEAKYEWQNGDSRSACLVISSKDNSIFPTSFNIRLLPSLPPFSTSASPTTNPIPSHRLSPSQISLRTAHATGTATDPTPSYNNALFGLALPKSHIILLHHASTTIPEFSDALKIFKVWANQRGYCSTQLEDWGIEGWEGRSMFWACLVAVIVLGEEVIGNKKKGSTIWGPEKPIIQMGKGLSSYQLFRAALELLATRDFSTQPLVMKSISGDGSTDPFPKEQWLGLDVPVFVDPSGGFNLLDGVSGESMKLLALDARQTLVALNQPSSLSSPNSTFGAGAQEEDIFRDTFAKDHREPLGRFDAYLEFDLSSVTKIKPEGTVSELDQGSWRRSVVDKIEDILKKGLGNRVRCMVLTTGKFAAQSVSKSSSAPFPNTLSGKLGIGLLFNTAEAYRLVDHGPAPTSSDSTKESEDIRAFHQLWGSKAELRRFKDGAIHESVVWELPTSMDVLTARERIPSRIVRYLLDHHFGVKEENVVERLKDLDEVMFYSPQIRKDLGAVVNTGWGVIQGSFDAFVKLLQSVSSSDDVPLALNSVRPASPYMRYTSVFPALPLARSSSNSGIPTTWSLSVPASARYIPANNLILHFEKSSKWPDDLAALQYVKLALLEALARALLQKADWGGFAHVVTGSASHRGQLEGELENWNAADKSFLEVLTPEGFAFHCWVFAPREAVLLRRTIDPPKAHNPLQGPPPSPRDRALAEQALHVHVRRYIHAPRHHAAFLTLHHRFPTFAHTIRLVKRILNAHLLGGNLEEETIELLACAAIFEMGRAEREELKLGNAARGLVHVLRWLRDWDWVKGVNVGLYEIAKMVEGSKSGSEGSQQHQFSWMEVEEANPSDILTRGASYHLRTSLDPSGTVFTASGQPSPVIARRVTRIAKACYDAIVTSSKASAFTSADIADSPNLSKTLFAHPLEEHYDFVIHLKHPLPRGMENVDRILQPHLAQGSDEETYRNLALGTESSDSIAVGFDPALSYYQDLKWIFADTAELLFDTYGGRAIGGVWNPALTQKEGRKWRVMSRFNAEPLWDAGTGGEGETQTEVKTKGGKKGKGGKVKDTITVVALNKAGVLEEMKRMGDGIAERIVVRGEDDSQELHAQEEGD